ncbi:MAG: tRNA pseudouridine(55) synthase TruB [Fluviibacter sp.]
MSFEDLPVIPRPDQWRNLDGVVLLDKPVGLTSNQALQWCRRLFAANKGGHTGTLDPFATGVLPLCLGEATKFSADLLNADKTYLATVRFGQRTDTGDLTGTITETTDQLPTPEQLQSILEQFTGDSEQIPPMYSALKRDGQPLYKLARAGIEVERQPRKIHLQDLVWSALETNQAGRVVTANLSVRCSKGTYIRTLAEDIAVSVGSVAHLVALRRTRVGDVSLEGCKTLEQLVTGVGKLASSGKPSDEQLIQAQLLRPADFLVKNLPQLEITDQQAILCRHGNPFKAEAGQTLASGNTIRIYLAGRFIGVGQVEGTGKDQKIQPVRLVSTSNS